LEGSFSPYFVGKTGGGFGGEEAYRRSLEKNDEPKALKRPAITPQKDRI